MESNKYKSEIYGVVDLVIKDREEMLVAVNAGKLTYKLLRLPLIGDFKQGDKIKITINRD